MIRWGLSTSTLFAIFGSVVAQFGGGVPQQAFQPQNQFQSQRFPQQPDSNRQPQQQFVQNSPFPGMNGQRFGQPPPQPPQALPQQLPKQQRYLGIENSNPYIQQQQPFYPARRPNPQSRQSGHVKQGGFLTTPTRQNNNPRTILPNAATFELRFNSYQNPQLTLPGGRTCDCPQPNGCTFLKNIASPCLFSFTVVVSSADQSVYYYSTDFIPLNKSGLVAGSSSEWALPFALDLTTKPQSIDIFVHNLGPVIDQNTAQAIYFDYLVLVDTFVIDLRDYVPLGYGDQFHLTTGEYTGQLVRSNLQASFGVQCKAAFMGALCDLKCDTTGMRPPTNNNNQLQNIQPNTQPNQGMQQNNQPSSNRNNNVQQQAQATVICSSILSNISRQCTFVDNRRSQVKDCLDCRFGVIDNVCRNATITPNDTQGVSVVYQVLAIVFGILLLVFLVIAFVICLCVLLSTRKKKKDRRPHPDYNRVSGTSPQYDRSRNPLLQTGNSSVSQNLPSVSSDEWSRGPPPTAIKRGIKSLPAPIADLNETSPNENDLRFLTPSRREAQV